MGGLQAVTDLWPTAFISFWAYPFIALSIRRQRRERREYAKFRAKYLHLVQVAESCARESGSWNTWIVEERSSDPENR